MLVAVSPARAASCAELRASVEARIRAQGVPDAVVIDVEAKASAPGRVVGSCQLGTRKLVYQRGGGAAKRAEPAAAPASAARPATAAARRAREVVITECLDGRVITEGSCRR